MTALRNYTNQLACPLQTFPVLAVVEHPSQRASIDKPLVGHQATTPHVCQNRLLLTAGTE
jgi:hypothetical protein